MCRLSKSCVWFAMRRRAPRRQKRMNSVLRQNRNGGGIQAEAFAETRPRKQYRRRNNTARKPMPGFQGKSFLVLAPQQKSRPAAACPVPGLLLACCERRAGRWFSPAASIFCPARGTAPPRRCVRPRCGATRRGRRLCGRPCAPCHRRGRTSPAPQTRA